MAAAAGRAFEEAALGALRRCRMVLGHTGGAGDRGIDLRGRWSLPADHGSPTTVAVVAQCKAEKDKCGPVHLRELEGVLSREPRGTLGLLITRSGFTAKTRQHFRSSPLPLMLCGLDDATLRFHQLSINNAATLLLPTLVIGESAAPRADGSPGRAPVLMCVVGGRIEPLAAPAD